MCYSIYSLSRYIPDEEFSSLSSASWHCERKEDRLSFAFNRQAYSKPNTLVFGVLKCSLHLSSIICFFPHCNIITTYSLWTLTIFMLSLLFPCHKLNSSLPGPFTSKRSERILDFHQLPTPLDISLMNCRAHT